MNKFMANISGMTWYVAVKTRSTLKAIGAAILSLVIVVVKQHLNCPMILRLECNKARLMKPGKLPSQIEEVSSLRKTWR